MFKIPKEKTYTQEELTKKVSRLKSNYLKHSNTRSQLTKELFLNAEEGRIRVLGYNLGNLQKLPLFINIHGGGFILGSPEMDDPYMMNVALNANVKILSIDYSLAPEAMFPKGLNECYAVIKYAQNHSQEFRIDPHNIAVGGHNSGGNLSAAICLKNSETKELNIKGLILDQPTLDIYTDPYLKQVKNGIIERLSLYAKKARILNECYHNNKEERKNPLISPVYASQEQLKTFPPALILTAGKDSLCKEAELFKDKLKEAGVDVTHKRFEASAHGFTFSDKPDAKEGWQMMIEHLKRYLFTHSMKVTDV
jgi:acetyl esterase